MKKVKKIQLNNEEYEGWFDIVARNMMANPSSKQRCKMIDGLLNGKYKKIQLDEETCLDIKNKTLITKI